DAAAEYCRLFVLPKGVTQQASHWIPGETEDIGHKLVAGVSQVLDGFDLQIQAQAMGNVPRDNVALLLLLAARLYEEDATSATRHGDEFVTTFVVPWAAHFSAALAKRTDNPVYRATARLLAEILPEQS